MSTPPGEFDTDLRACFPPPLAAGPAESAPSARTAGPLDLELPSWLFVGPPSRAESSTSSAVGSREGGASGSRPASSESAVAPDAELPELGAILDKYRIEKLIGTGGFAAVYRATHLMLQMPVAIKLLRPKVIRKRPGLAALLWEEARYAARINHPNVVRVFDVAHSGTITYVVMEFIDGQSLAEAISAQGALPVAAVLKVGIDVAAGLRAGLEQELIHRDVKPANVLLTAHGDAKLVDLGLAYPNRESTPGSGDRGRSWAVIGTPGYMAPEQAENPEKVDFRADIYSLGVTLYHAAVGRAPFPTKEPLAEIVRRQHQPVTPPARLVPSIPAEVSRLILWMLAPNPADRPASYEVLLEALRKGLALVGQVARP